MKLRMYLRGLGLGLIVAALVLSFSTKTNNKMSDAEIRSRAKELGMVDESSTLKDVESVVDKTEPTKTPTPTPEPTKTPTPTPEPTEEPTPEPTKTPTPTPEPTKAPAKDKVDASKVITKKTYTLTIVGGYSSDRVARILEDAGIIDSASAFDKYLCDNNYDNRISTGNYSIPAGSDFATIAKIITNSK